MNIYINDKEYQVVITYKKIKNMYLRVKDDLKIYITCSKLVKEKEIIRFIENNIKMIDKQLDIYIKRNKEQENKLLFLGKYYDILYINKKDIIFGNNQVFMGRNFNVDNFYKKEALKIFKERLDYQYKRFEEDIPYPSLKIRKMTSKWGVCNTKEKVITLNLLLIKLDPKYLDYVIIHELSHLVYPNHSKSFWDLVNKYVIDYKIYRKEMKNII